MKYTDTPSPTRVALLGGSFNPPHMAHQMIVLWLLSTNRADQVWMVPCYDHPLGKHLLPFAHRFAMCELALACFPPQSAVVSRVEETLGTESRTLYTVQRLKAEHPHVRFSLAIGSDILAERTAWYRFDELERLVDLVVIGRTGHAAVPGVPMLPGISSSAIRASLGRNEDVSSVVPAKVLEYIQAQGLYGPTR